MVEDAKATAFRSRSWWGEVAIDSRTDLLRLMAHARASVDLCPGGASAANASSRCSSAPRSWYRARARRCSTWPAGADSRSLIPLICSARQAQALGRPKVRGQLSLQARDLAAQFADATSFVRRMGEGLRHLLVAS